MTTRRRTLLLAAADALVVANDYDGRTTLSAKRQQDHRYDLAEDLRRTAKSEAELRTALKGLLEAVPTDTFTHPGGAVDTNHGVRQEHAVERPCDLCRAMDKAVEALDASADE